MTETPLTLTPVGWQRLERELHELRSVRRNEVVEQIRQAKSLGDIAENAEYEEAKTEQALLQSRIDRLSAILGTAAVLEAADVPTERAGLGSALSVRDLESGEEWELTLVSPPEADPDSDLVSVECPIGASLLGKAAGEVIEVAVPAGVVRYELVSIQVPTRLLHPAIQDEPVAR